AFLPELIQEILDLLRSHLWAGHGDLVLDALPTEWPRATGERGREVEAEQDDHDPQQSITLHRGSSSFRCGHELGDGWAGRHEIKPRAPGLPSPQRGLSRCSSAPRAREILPGSLSAAASSFHARETVPNVPVESPRPIRLTLPHDDVLGG